MKVAYQTIAVSGILLVLAVSLVGVASQSLPARVLQVETPGSAAAEGEKAVRQTIYVPVYSHIYFGGTGSKGRRRFPLAVTLSIRSTDLHKPLMVTSVRYYDTAGQFLQEYVKQPLRLGPLASTEVFVEERDMRGGVGANFIVEWSAAEPVTAPLVEAVMIGTAVTQGISFLSPGRVISHSSQ
jgi:hypothetical protein